MKKFEKYGTLLTRSEAKEIRGGNGDDPNPLNPDPEGGVYGPNECTGKSKADCKGQCTMNGLSGRCNWSNSHNACGCDTW